MQLEWPREVRRRADGAGVAYELPVRSLGALRWVGFFLCVFGVLFIAGPLIGLVGEMTRLANHGTTKTTDWVALLFMIPFVFVGIVPLAIGSFIAFGRCRIECWNRRLQELRWIATHLRRTLGVAQPPPMQSQPAAADAPRAHSTST